MFAHMKALAYFLIFVFAAIALFWAPSCANIIPPAGGPRDSIPPVLLKATPADSTLNFSGKQIEFQFDEYVDLQDVQNNLLFTPTFERNPEIAVKGKNKTVFRSYHTLPSVIFSGTLTVCTKGT